MIEVYKIMEVKYDTEVSNNILRYRSTEEKRNTRGHSKRLSSKRWRTNTGRFKFSNRIVPIWNGLTEKVISAPSLLSFERRLDKLWINKPMVYDMNEVYKFEHNMKTTNHNERRYSTEESASESS